LLTAVPKWRNWQTR